MLLVGATTVFSELKDSLDDIWQIPKAPTSGILTLIRTRLLSFGLILVLGFLLLVSLVVNAALALLQSYWSGIWSEFLVVLTPLASMFSFLVIAAMFALGKYVIGVYLGNSGVTSTYGAAGSLAALLIWIYYSAQIFFFGAEFTRQYALAFGSLRNTPTPAHAMTASDSNAINTDPPKAFLTSRTSTDPGRKQ